MPYTDERLLATLRMITGVGDIELADHYRKKVARYLDVENEDSHHMSKEGAAFWHAVHEHIAKQDILELYWRPRTPGHEIHFYPGGDSEQGFLGWGERLDEIIAQDTATLKALNRTHFEIGLALKAILDLPDYKIDQKIYDVSGYEVKSRSWMGYQNCPFDGCDFKNKYCRHSSSDFVLTSKKTRREIAGPGLIWHLIAEHCFFEGKGTDGGGRILRVEPAELIKVLFHLD